TTTASGANGSPVARPVLWHDAISAKYTALFSKGVNICRSMGALDPEAVFQDSFLSFKPSASLVEHKDFDWKFFRRLWSRCKGEYRRRMRQQERETAWVENDGCTQSDDSLRQEQIARLMKLIARLSPEEQQALKLRYWGKSSITEMGDLLCEPEGTLKA